MSFKVATTAWRSRRILDEPYCVVLGGGSELRDLIIGQTMSVSCKILRVHTVHGLQTTLERTDAFGIRYLSAGAGVGMNTT